MASRVKGMVPLLAVVALAGLASMVKGDECNLTPVFHVLQYPGCIPKPIPSFACMGKCTSYVQVCKIDPAFETFSSKQINSNCLSFACQVSGSKLWETERSCMCCQESGEREATVSLFCPNAPPDQPKIRKVYTSNN